jgi:hypothetical protein
MCRWTTPSRLLSGPIFLTSCVIGAAVAGDANPSEDPRSAPQAVVRSAAKAASQTAAIGLAASLEMKENVDFLLAPAFGVRQTLLEAKAPMVCFDTNVELNAPLCRTYVVLFPQYWVSRNFYRVAVVWAEPHAGSLNFPIYPPTLNIVSDPNSFRINHQLVHTYDGAFVKPLGPRGPFRHRFNSYPLSEIRFGEQEALELRARIADARRPPDSNAQDGVPQPKRRTVFLPERPITVAFRGEGPTITIGGQKRHYSELEITDPPGGRKWIVDYQPVQLSGRAADLPSRIEVYPGDGKQLLRRARMYNVTGCEETPEQIARSAEQFSFFDPNETLCRDLLIKYWLKSRSEMAQDDIEALERLRRHFGGELATGMTIGEQLKRINMLVQVHWMLDDPNGLTEDFREYTRLLRSNGLGRMILYGGENLIETTSRWGQIDTANRLLPLWLDTAVSENDMASILNFASASLAQGGVWTTAKLLEKALESHEISGEDRFLAGAFRSIALSRVRKMIQNPDGIKSDLGIAQARWALTGTTEVGLREELRVSATAARKSFDPMVKPTRQDRALKIRLDAIVHDLLAQESIEKETSIGNP